MSYFAREYGLSYAAAFDSCQAESEPSARLIVKIIEKMKEDGAVYVFYEEMTDPKAARIIAERQLYILQKGVTDIKIKFYDIDVSGNLFL